MAGVRVLEANAWEEAETLVEEEEEERSGGRDYIVGEVAGTRLISTVEILDRTDRSRLTVRLECLTAAEALESEPSGPG